MANITLDDFVQQANSSEDVKNAFLENPILAMKNSGVEFDIKNFAENLSLSNVLTIQAPAPPTIETFWWGYRVRISAEFLKWLSVGGLSVGAIILILAPILIALGPLGVAASAVVAALAVYILTQHTVLLIKAQECGGTVCLDALWITPCAWVPTCCQ